jgi:hypothetical protein
MSTESTDDSPSSSSLAPPLPTTAAAATSLATSSTTTAPDFAALLKERSKQRRDREDAAVAALRVQVQRLEAALQAETKRRVVVTQHLKEAARGEWERIEGNLRQQYGALANQSQGRWLSLEDRLSQLEDNWKQDVLSAEQGLTETTRALEGQLAGIEEQALQDKQGREAMQERLSGQIGSIASLMQTEWKEEETSRLQALQELHEQWETHRRENSQQDSTDRLEQEVEQLRRALVQERMERERQDDYMIQGWKDHTNSLQQGLNGILPDF